MFSLTMIRAKPPCAVSSQAHRRTGTTGCLPTLIADRSNVVEQVAAVAPGSLRIPGMLGFHLEGPALNKE
jgi:N-acetylglucosamine-6-phosphate deacetylase